MADIVTTEEAVETEEIGEAVETAAIEEAAVAMTEEVVAEKEGTADINPQPPEGGVWRLAEGFVSAPKGNKNKK